MTTTHDHAKRGDGQYPGSAEQRIARGEATMTAKPAPETINISKIGCTRTVQTAVLVCAYLRARHAWLPSDAIYYHFTEATDKNGHWLADILVKEYPAIKAIEITDLIHECRAFAAGRGEVWA